MDIKTSVTNIFDTIKEKVKDLYEKIREFVEENKMISLIIAVIFILILLLLILLSASIKTSKDAKDKSKNILQPVTLTEEILLPKAHPEEDNYILSRNLNEKWTTEEAAEWFNIPSEKEIENLSKTNDSLVNDILKATP